MHREEVGSLLEELIEGWCPCQCQQRRLFPGNSMKLAPGMSLGISRPSSDQLPAVHFLALKHALLILLHEPAVARHVGDEDGRESALD